MRTVIRLVVATASLLIVLPVAQVDAQVRALPGASSVGDGIEKSIATPGPAGSVLRRFVWMDRF